MGTVAAAKQDVEQVVGDGREQEREPIQGHVETLEGSDRERSIDAPADGQREQAA
jgi:hypothetical protein